MRLVTAKKAIYLVKNSPDEAFSLFLGVKYRIYQRTNIHLLTVGALRASSCLNYRDEDANSPCCTIQMSSSPWFFFFLKHQKLHDTYIYIYKINIYWKTHLAGKERPSTSHRGRFVDPAHLRGRFNVTSQILHENRTFLFKHGRSPTHICLQDCGTSRGWSPSSHLAATPTTHPAHTHKLYTCKHTHARCSKTKLLKCVFTLCSAESS